MSKVSFWSFYNNYCYDEKDISMLLQMDPGREDAGNKNLLWR